MQLLERFNEPIENIVNDNHNILNIDDPSSCMLRYCLFDWFHIDCCCCCSCILSVFSKERTTRGEKKANLEIYLCFFRKSNFVENRGLWSPSPDDESSNKSKDAHSIPFDDKSQNWRTEHQWSASSSLKCEDIPVNITENNQSAPFSPFRQAANEIERLQKEAREFTRRKAEEEHAEEAQAHDGKNIDMMDNRIVSFHSSCKTFRSIGRFKNET